MKNNIIKAAVIVFAAITVLGRFVTYKYYELLSSSVLFAVNAVCIVSAALLILCAVIWIIAEKKLAKSADAKKQDVSAPAAPKDED